MIKNPVSFMAGACFLVIGDVMFGLHGLISGFDAGFSVGIIVGLALGVGAATLIVISLGE